MSEYLGILQLCVTQCHGTVKLLISARAFIRIILPFSERDVALIKGYCFGDGKRRSKNFYFWSICDSQKGITSDAIAMPVRHIFFSPGESTIISSVFIDLHEY